MSITWAAAIFVLCSLYGYMLFRRGAYMQTVILSHFSERIHSPNVQEVMSEEEHELIHDKMDIFHLQVLSCLIAVMVGVGSSVFFLGLAATGGNGNAAGYILALAFAYLAANYNMNSSMTRWLQKTENDLLARVIQQQAEANGQTVPEYLEQQALEAFESGTNIPLTEYEQQTLIGDEFKEALFDEGYDPFRDYNETVESRREFIRVFTAAADKLNEKYTEPREN